MTYKQDMSKIYTKTGDKGQTSLFDGTRVPKNHIRVETYGTIDELNSQLGLVVSQLQKNGYQEALRETLAGIQEDLFLIGSFLANPANPASMPSEKEKEYLGTVVVTCEKKIDAMTSEMETLTGFILPGGHPLSASLHVARTITRRAERRIIELLEKEAVAAEIVKYFNRLSDLLFTMSRYVNFKEDYKDILWVKRV